ncbi:hypothetical protein AtubIFM55763_006076 [Aspergillus tubingensis]|uniref:Oxidoreductase FAD/NAD(P)-binding domain-containing protein n=1 Tax=Aspergillus tubingensis TaxID=5068 RepID=A0A8H3Y478_ASPTU|nr:oxidoreductase, FAD-binding protein [Aspergillus tubingensis]GFN20961.1 oxidoreductase, FAD-binding protein [Aspergillus tubingensis]GLA74830.1 hypothetical protein AtubIFM55763_006076 [Aspergillus tubingensis]GLA88919.1 hypothetical protein AtubIFM56815_003386 [Aspergillus tubingensis]GLA99318.1 hypothetical protein AtubIFM57143_007625 [Aspergillus tubingensis]GLB23041.1 hypothetical protein AtubIFM61612_003625 [Aspergillus tubingensis]
MAIPALQGWHPGEVAIQGQLGYATAVSSHWTAVENQLREQHQIFHTSNLPFIPLTTTDADGRPWGGIVAGSTGTVGFVDSPNLKSLVFRPRLWEGDPILPTLQGWRSVKDITNHQMEGRRSEERSLTAGLGIEFPTRRRNKFAGKIQMVKAMSHYDYIFEVEITEALGNCPKYINVRQLDPFPWAKPHLVYQSLHMAPTEKLPPEVIDMIESADTVFVATIHRPDPTSAAMFPSHAGMNSRGGFPGFLRVRPSDRRSVVLPDYSGNRFMNSLGNIESSGLAGFTIISFTTGDILYLTGTARNYVGPSALEIMSRHATITVLSTTGFTLVRNALPVRQRKGSEVGRSPYTPKVKYLVEEGQADAGGAQGHKAMLEKGMQMSDDLAIFRFEVISKGDVQPLRIRPGQAIVLDFMDWIGPPPYQHMADSAPGSINDDRVRTWTVSSAHEDTDVAWFEITMREMKGGVVTKALFDVLRLSPPNRWDHPIFLEGDVVTEIVGVTGEFTLNKREVNLLLVAGGIGITPFLAMLSAMSTREDTPQGDIVLVLSTREPEVMLTLIEMALLKVPSAVKVKVDLFTSCSVNLKTRILNHQSTSISIHEGRIGPEYWQTSTRDKDVFICGPKAFADAAVDGLRSIGVPNERIQREGFY